MPRKNLKKRGPRTTVRVKPRRLFKTKGVSKFVADVWDHKETLRHNFKVLGYSEDANKLQAGISERLSDTPAILVDLEEVQAVAQARLKPESNTKRPLHFISDDEMGYLKALVGKYGSDYVKMARDIKLNNMQHTAKHLETRIARMNSFLTSEK
jgi:Ribosome biogenesis protein Nop16